MAKIYFPLGIATGAAFCNRKAERKAMAGNLLAGRHTWLMAPRRYGKTSLVQQVIQDLKRSKVKKIAAVTIDLLVAYDAESLQAELLDGVGRLSSSLLPLHRQAIKGIQAFFASLRPEIVIDESGPKLRFTPSGGAPKNIVDALEGLDRIAKKSGARAVFVVDEFQQLAEIRKGKLEGAIRHAVERAKHVTYVFSGSRRHLLARMFDDSTRPLYRLCERIALERISVTDYTRFLRTNARARWRKTLSDATIENVLACSKCHSYYFNLLCARLWQNSRPPKPEEVIKEWDKYVREERHGISKELVECSPIQRAVMHAIAIEPTASPRSKAFLRKTRLASASAGQAVSKLLQNDLLYENDNGVLHVLDPALEWYLRR